MQEINDFYRYSMTIDNYKISTNDFTRDILVTVFDKQNCFRIERGKKHRYNGNAISRYMTKVKLGKLFIYFAIHKIYRNDK